MGPTRYSIENEHVQPVFDPTEQNKEFLTNLKEKLKLNIIHLDREEVVFDLIGVDASIANALRRIMIAEIPTMAIENVYILINTSMIHDEILAHRLGLIPINADPRQFEALASPEDDTTELNTLVFHLHVQCPQDYGKESNDPTDQTMSVYSNQLVWQPHGEQEERFGETIHPIHDDILVAKLRPGQEIRLEAHCRKGVGKDHAKYSPVATASYRLMPDITFSKPVKDAKAEELKNKCPMNVFDIEDLGKHHKIAKVARPRDCTMCRECIREGDWSEYVKLQRIADHFIFKVEAVGMLSPRDIVIEAFRILKEKCEVILQEMQSVEEATQIEDIL